MPRGGARRGAGRKALDQPTEPLLTYSLMLRPTDVGYLNQLGRGNLSLGLRRLIAFRDGGDHRILLLTQPRVSELNIILVLGLAEAEIEAVLLILAAESGENGSAFGSGERVRGGIEVFLELDHQIQRQTGRASLELVVENEICDVKPGSKMGFTRSVEIGCVGHAVGSKGARRKLG